MSGEVDDESNVPMMRRKLQIGRIIVLGENNDKMMRVIKPFSQLVYREQLTDEHDGQDMSDDDFIQACVDAGYAEHYQEPVEEPQEPSPAEDTPPGDLPPGDAPDTRE